MTNEGQVDRILAAVESLEAETIERLQELVRIPSVTGNEYDVQQAVARQMDELNLEVDQWEPDVDQLAEYAEHVGEFESLAGRPNVVGTWRGTGDGRSLILNAHIDTVEPGDRNEWTVDPFGADVRDGLVYGRGTCDMKAGLVAELIALRALSSAGVVVKGDVIVQSVISEEDGGAGALATILRGYSADATIITEPTNQTIITAHGGSLVFRVTIPGRSAHACVRNEGVSAVEKFIPIHQALLDLERNHHESIAHPMFAHYANRAPINIGTVRSGNWPSSVPESLIFEGRAGLVPGETLDETRDAFLAAILGAVERDPWLREHPPVVEWFSGQFTASETAADHPIVKTLQRAHLAVNGRRSAFDAVTYGADMRHFVNIGHIPCIMYGAGDVTQAHRPNEYVPINQVLNVAKALALTVVDWCGLG